MNYAKIYINLIRRRIRHPISKSDIGENHHIFPQSIFGRNNKIVRLTIKEHFVAHKLLYKMCYTRYGKSHEKTIKMLFAIKSMMNHSRNYTRSSIVMLLPTKMMIEARSTHPAMTQEVRDKISKSERGTKKPTLAGYLNPAKNPETRQKISESKTGKSRDDMKGKAYFGADDDTIIKLKHKISKTRTGQKINYPDNRAPVPCSTEKAKKISEARSATRQKFIEMIDTEFEMWISRQNLYTKDNKRKNSNVTRVLAWRGIDQDIYYKSEYKT